ncbi:MAG: hypothetical protein COB38_10950 [Gammaproteobacteria bacterium]|nr:MAG: hypothetical protein COB38_10950 [Gammaproteobacteria bacterium]
MKKILLLIALLPFYATADFFNAINDYQNRKYKSAYNQFLEMAKMGETRSQFNLGVMFYNGQYVDKDINQAYAWLKLATENEAATDQEKQTFNQISSQIAQQKLAQKAFSDIENYSNKNLLVSLYPEFLNTQESNPDNATPLKIVQPKYPRNAAIRGLQGWVKYQFDLDIKGHPRNIILIESIPGDTFVKNSLRAISKWRFQPSKDKAGAPIPTKNILYTMEFKLSNTDNIQIKDSALRSAEDGHQQNHPHSTYQLALWSKYGLIKDSSYNSTKLFLQSAVQGHPIAQFETGRSLVLGKGCKQDKSKGLIWLNRAASNGQAEAKEMLANVLMSNKDITSQRQASSYFGSIEKPSPLTKINFAKLLVYSKFTEILDPKRAINIVDDISHKTYRDNITLYEIKAAAYFKIGKIKKAISYQEDALEEAKDIDADTTQAKETLEKYLLIRNSI